MQPPLKSTNNATKKMKKLLLIIGLCSVLGFAGCDRNAHKDDNGLVIALSMPVSDPIEDIRVWLFDSREVLIGTFDYVNASALALARHEVETGDYTVVVATNVKEPFTTNFTGSKTPLQNLLIGLSDASASPVHLHYGLKKTTVKAEGLTLAMVDMSRAMAELQFTITNVPAEIVDAQIEVINTACGFYPAKGLLTQEIQVADLGRVAPQNRQITFPLKRIMPTANNGSESETQTQLRVTFRYQNGGTLKFYATAPAMVNGGIYTPRIDYVSFRPGLELQITQINGWIEQPAINGEILNPDK